MGDAIRRVAALATVEKMYKICEGNLSDYHDLLVACFTDLTPAQRWIPSYVGENVPEYGDSVLVTFKNSDGEADVYIARWGGDYYDCGYFCLSVSEVMAFMPLPEPWKGEK